LTSFGSSNRTKERREPKKNATMTAAMTKLCLGGAFNPIHHGHLLIARAAAESLGIDCVVLIPTHEPPHKKFHTNMAPAADRLAMCRLAVATIDNSIDGSIGSFEVDDRELRRSGPSYTIDTIRELSREGWSNIPWLIGADQLDKLHTWRQPHDLLKEAQLYILARPGFPLDFASLPPEYHFLANRVVPAPAIDISASDIRSRIAKGLPIDFLTPPAVCRYIKDNALYRA
jgi:nicotinate-nucleotide adenylyltransferase